MTCLAEPANVTNPDDAAIMRAVDAAGLGTWEIELGTDRAVHRSRHHDSIFGHETPVSECGFALAARQVIDADRPAFQQAVELARRTGVLHLTTRILRPDGEIRWIGLTGTVLPGRPGATPRMAGTVIDVTGRLASQARLRESEARLRLALDLSALGVMEWDIQADRLTWSGEILRIFGLAAFQTATPYATWREMVVPVDLERTEALIADAMARQAARLPLGYRIRRPDGEIREIEALVAFTYGPDGTPLFCVGVNRDITDDRRAARTRARSEARYRAMFDQAAVGVVETDASGRWRRVNTRLVEMLGYESVVELVGRTDAEMTHPDDRVTGTELAASLMAGQVAHFARDQRMLRKDGTSLWVHVTVSLVREARNAGSPHRIAIIVDATERKQAELALADAEARLRVAQDAADAGFWDLDVVRNTITFSDAYARIRGLPAGMTASLSARERMAQVHVDDRKRLRGAVAEALVSGTYDQEFRIIRPDGAVRYVVGRGRTQYDSNGNPVRLIGMTVDVTTRRESELRLLLAMEGTGLATWDLDIATGQLLLSANYYPLFGYSSDPSGRATYAMWADRVHPDDLVRIKEVVATSAMGCPYRVVYRIRRANDGAERWMESVARIFESDSAGRPRRRMGITLDVTDRETSRLRLQEQQAELLHISRIADTGVMASALAHELSQPLTAASSAVQGAFLHLARIGTAKLPDLATDLETLLGLAESQLTRAGQIVAGLREFVMPHTPMRRSEALRPLIDDARNLALIGHGTPADRIVIAVPASLPAVSVDGVQIRQVLFNLMRNAVQSVEQHHDTPEARSVSVTASAQAGAVEIAVADNGHGLPASVAARLFEPFTTSKSDGMGIGLSICRSIVEAHGGQIHATPNAQGGMTFRFTVPLAYPDTTGAPADAS